MLITLRSEPRTRSPWVATIAPPAGWDSLHFSLCRRLYSKVALFSLVFRPSLPSRIAFSSEIRHIPLSVTRSGKRYNSALVKTVTWNEVDLSLVRASPPRVLRHKISARNISK